MLKTPILLVAFNRPDLTEQVFHRIREVCPVKLYLAVDGPRQHHPDDLAACEATRAIADKVDWPCEVKTLFRDRNHGCRVGVSSAIDWFFEHEREGIILEDDCVASPTFFYYCGELLVRYRDDERVMVISGNNFQQGRQVSPDSYYFSRYNHCWGWATWRRAWQYYDRDMNTWPAFREAGKLSDWADGNPGFIRYWHGIFGRAAAGEIDSWAYRWTYSCWARNGLTALPERNLVCNIGWDDRATHTKPSGGREVSLRAENLVLPLRHPERVKRNLAADRFTDASCFGILMPRPLLNQAASTFARALKRLLHKANVELNRLSGRG